MAAAGFGLLLAYLGVLLLRPQEFVPALAGVPLVPVLLGTTALAWLLGQPKSWTAPQHRFMPGLVAALSVSLLAIGWRGGAWQAQLDFAPTLLLYAVMATAVDTPQRWRAVCVVLVAGAAVIALHGIGQAADPQGLGWTGEALNHGRITYLGRLNDPNDLAMALLMVLPLALHLAWWWQAWWARGAALAAAGLLLWGVWLCQSRGALLALLAMLALWVWRRRGAAWALAAVLPAGLLALLLAPGRLAEMSADEESAAGRIDAWYAGLDMLRQHPVWGVGKGLFGDHHEITAHNSLVLALAELGLVGAFFWIGLLVASVVVVWRVADPGAWAGADDAPVAIGSAAAAGVIDPVDAEDDDDTPPRLEVRAMAVALSYSHVAVLVCAFFLSRTYVDLLFLPVALSAAAHEQACSNPAGIEPVSARGLIGAVLCIEAVAVAGLALLVRLLLH